MPSRTTWFIESTSLRVITHAPLFPIGSDNVGGMGEIDRLDVALGDLLKKPFIRPTIERERPRPRPSPDVEDGDKFD